MTDESARGGDGASDPTERLRERVSETVVPRLATALVRARGIDDPGRDELDATYRATLVLLFRLLFVAYAEHEGILPRSRTGADDEYALTTLTGALVEGRFDRNATTLWDRVTRLTRAVHEGDAESGVPAYGGRLFAPDEAWTGDEPLLSGVELTDDEFGPVLAALLVEETPDGQRGAVDFGAVDVRAFGAIYEGLLDADLSVADRDLTIERQHGTERYVPAAADDDVLVTAGEVYLHGQSGERKAAGAYYTDSRFVAHLLDDALEPALTAHLERVDRCREKAGEAAAADALFDFRVADVAMGSGHVLLGAVDRLATAFRDYLREHPLPGVAAELDTLQERAAACDGVGTADVGRDRLLRRQIARRCLYGVDRNELATELARLSLWLHTFVPGRPLTAFDHTLRTGDSLAGIGTLGEVHETVDEAGDGGGQEAPVLDEIRESLAELGTVVDTAAERARPGHETRRVVDERLAPIRARLDVLAAARVDDDVDVEAAVEPGIADPGTTDLGDTDPGTADPTALPGYERAQATLGSTDPLHFPVAFPAVFAGGGFDVVVGNPPWEEAVLEEDEFWTRSISGFQGLAQAEQERRKAEMRTERPELVAAYEREREAQARRRRILRNGPYPGMGTGDPDTYKAFAWRFWDLLADGGHLGVVLPRSSLVAAGSERFRRTILEAGTVSDVTLLKNRGGWVFDAVTEQYTVALLAVEKTPPDPDATLPLRGPFPDRESYEAGLERDPYRFDLERARNWTGTASFPTFPADPRSVAAFERLAEHPPLGLDEAGAWRARPTTELHATNDRTADDGTPVMTFPDDPPDDYWPVFTGASFTHWTPDTGERFAWTDPEVAREYLQAQRENSYRYAGTRSAFYEMSERWVHDPATLPCRSPRVVFRDVARSTDGRTVIPALVPPETVLTNKAPYLVWPRGDERDEAYLLGVMSSIPFDWYARRFVEIGVNYHILNAIPVPRPGRESALRRRVVELAGRLAAVDDRYGEWADAVGVAPGPLDTGVKRAYVHELDAVVAHLYGLEREHLEVVFETFHEDSAMGERLGAVSAWYETWADRDGDPETGG